MDHSEFFKLIRTGLPGSTFLLHGEEEYVKAQAVKAIERSIDEDLRPFNFAALSKPSPQELMENCETLPLFADQRCVVCYELADNTEPTKYADVISGHPAETALIIAVKGELSANSALLKLVKKSGEEVKFSRLSQTDRAKWVIKHCSEAGVEIDRDTALLLVRMVGDDMADLVGETDKLIDFAGEGGLVTPQHISACIRASLDVRIFDMLDLFTAGRTADGIKALHALMDEGSDAMGISGFLSSRFKLMLEARRAFDAGKSKREFASSVEGSSYANEKAFEAAMKFTQEELLQLVSDLSDTAFIKISGRMKEDKYLEFILMKQNWRQRPVKRV
jgi:DNA polymerase-3 subunit delta